MLTEVDRLRYLIRLRLNPNDTYDRKVAAILKRIPELTHSSRPAELLTALEELTAATQLLIKEEWEKVKWEAKNGDLVEMKRLIE